MSYEISLKIHERLKGILGENMPKVPDNAPAWTKTKGTISPELIQLFGDASNVNNGRDYHGGTVIVLCPDYSYASNSLGAFAMMESAGFGRLSLDYNLWAWIEKGNSERYVQQEEGCRIGTMFIHEHEVALFLLLQEILGLRLTRFGGGRNA